MVWHTTFNRENVGSSPAERTQDADGKGVEIGFSRQIREMVPPE